MGERILYEGCLPVAAVDHRHEVEVGDGYVEQEVPDLDSPVTRATMLTFTLDYPFERPFHGKVWSRGGISLRRIVDAVRAGFRTMYAGAAAEPIPNLANQLVRGSYGTAHHVIEDLVIERIALDDDAGELTIGIGS